MSIRQLDQHSITTIDLLRHGECTDGHCYRGSTDVALSPKGWQQMRLSIGETEPDWHQVVTSPLLRCADFAESIAEEYQLPLVPIHDFREMHFGEWEGQSIKYIWDTQQAAVESWFADPVGSPPPMGEAADVFAQRVVRGFSQLINHHSGEKLLLIAHGGVIRVLLTHCLSMPLLAINRFDIPYACLSRLQIIQSDDDKPHYRLLAHNLMAKTIIDD